MPSSPGAEELREQITHLWHGRKRGYPTRTCHSVIVGIDMLDAFFRERLENFDRIKLVPIPPDTQQRIAAGPEISGCNGCERD